MNLKISARKIAPHLLAVLCFIVLASIYFNPVFSGKVLQQGDLIQLSGAGREVKEFRENGEGILWTNAMFSGMPHFSSAEKNPFSLIHVFFRDTVPRELYVMVLLFVGFYLAMIGLKCSIPISFISAFTYSFCTFTIISLGVGHVNKVEAMASIVPICIGVYLAYNKRLVYGLVITSLFLGLQVFYNHVQITYYTLIAVLIYALIEFVMAIREKKILSYLKTSFIILAIAVLTVLTNITTLWTLWDYQKSSNRGGSELSTNGNEKSGGLDKDYAFEYSYGKLESINMIIPYFMGGANTESLDKDSNVYKSLTRNGINRYQATNIIQSVPLYWGNQPIVGGPTYIGAIAIFLFTLALLLDKGKMKYWVISTVVLAILLSWGKNLAWFSNLFFDYVPLYNKFRAVTMILSLVQAMVIFYGFFIINQVLNAAEFDTSKFLKKLYQGTGITAGFCFVILITAGMNSFEGPNDARLALPDWFLSALEQDRLSLLRSDAFRSTILILISSALLWIWSKGKLKKNYLLGGLFVLLMVDTWVVDKRYLNSEDFTRPAKVNQQIFNPTEADLQILQDKSYYRVFNTTRGITQDGLTSYHHNSIGGYSAIKLGRYQELIENHIGKGNMNVLNMLNVKYFIVAQDNRYVAQRNPNALGPVWFVNEIQIVESADEEIQGLDTMDTKTEAIARDSFSELVGSGDFRKDSTASIELTSIHPEKMVYATKTGSEQFAVFSEIYYQPGWQAYIDDQPVEHARVNYVLRGLKIPAGEHRIEFRFNPPSYAKGRWISWSSTTLLILAFVGIGFKEKQLNNYLA